MKDYQKRANDNYRSKFDIVQIRLVKGTKEQIINNTGKSISQYIQDLIDKDLHNNFDLPYTRQKTVQTSQNRLGQMKMNLTIKLSTTILKLILGHLRSMCRQKRKRQTTVCDC